MSNKKRESSSVQESGVEHNQMLNSDPDNGGAEPSSKRVKKDKRKKNTEMVESENQNEVNTASTSSNAHMRSSNPMERRKQRKMQAKLKHIAQADRKWSMPDKMEVELKSVSDEGARTSSGSGGSVLPEFHIGVFKDLAAADPSIREAAAKALVTELREVQNAYDKLENKDDVEDKTKLEAEKDDGLNNLAPSLRYAVRRLIRGVSSSREVRSLALFGSFIHCMLFASYITEGR